MRQEERKGTKDNRTWKRDKSKSKMESKSERQRVKIVRQRKDTA